MKTVLGKIQVLKDNEVYRVADLLGKDKSDKLVKELLSNSRYWATIMGEYFEMDYGKYNYDALYNIIKLYSESLELYNNDNVLVHVRTGDDYKVRGLANEENFNFYLEEINKYPLDKTIVIVTAMHYGHKRNSKLYKGKANIYNDESYYYNIELLDNLISRIEHKVEICSNENVDLDLCYLSLADNLIATPNAGGFAKVVLELNKIHKKL